MIIQPERLSQLTEPNELTESSQLIAESPIENPSAWIQDGQSPTEVTLSVAILTLASLWGVALVLVAIAHLMKVLLLKSSKE